MAQINYPVTFDNNSLITVTGLTVLAINSYLMPGRQVIKNDIARTSTSKISTGFYNTKDIVVRIGISRDTRANAEASLDTLLGLIQGLEKTLAIIEGGAIRNYAATYSDFVLRTGGGAYIELDLVFTCSDRFGYSAVYEQLLDATARTLYNYTDSFTLNGNAATQVPVITAFLSAITAATTNTVVIKNVATGQGITVNRAWVAGDRLVIDCRTRTVTVNGVSVDFTGAFPEFAPGIGYLNYQDNFTTRTLALSVYYNRRFV